MENRGALASISYVADALITLQEEGAGADVQVDIVSPAASSQWTRRSPTWRNTCLDTALMPKCESFKRRQGGKHIPLDVYERVDGGGGIGEEALAQIRTRSELDNENSPRQIFAVKDQLRLSVMSK